MTLFIEGKIQYWSLHAKKRDQLMTFIQTSKILLHFPLTVIQRPHCHALLTSKEAFHCSIVLDCQRLLDGVVLNAILQLVEGDQIH